MVDIYTVSCFDNIKTFPNIVEISRIGVFRYLPTTDVQSGFDGDRPHSKASSTFTYQTVAMSKQNTPTPIPNWLDWTHRYWTADCTVVVIALYDTNVTNHGTNVCMPACRNKGQPRREEPNSRRKGSWLEKAGSQDRHQKFIVRRLLQYWEPIEERRRPVRGRRRQIQKHRTCGASASP
jgi:hypothetical protein